MTVAIDEATMALQFHFVSLIKPVAFFIFFVFIVIVVVLSLLVALPRKIIIVVDMQRSCLNIHWKMPEEIDICRYPYRGAQILRSNLFILSGVVVSQPVQCFSCFGPCTVLQCFNAYLWEFLSTEHDLYDVIC